MAAAEDGGEDAIDDIALTDDAERHLGAELRDGRHETLELVNVVVRRGVGNGHEHLRPRISVIRDGTVEVAFRPQLLCLRKISQADTFCPVSDSPQRDDGPGPMRYAGLGIQLAVSILVGVFGGQWLDRRLGTESLFTIVGAFTGFGGTMYSLVRQLNRTGRDGR